MSNRITFLAQAERDLEEQAAYLAAEAGLQTGLRFFEAVDETLSFIRTHPSIGRQRTFHNPELSGIRMCLVHGFPKYLVFYRLTPTGIEIVRLLHGARDIETLLER